MVREVFPILPLAVDHIAERELAAWQASHGVELGNEARDELLALMRSAQTRGVFGAMPGQELNLWR